MKVQDFVRALEGLGCTQSDGKLILRHEHRRTLVIVALKGAKPDSRIRFFVFLIDDDDRNHYASASLAGNISKSQAFWRWCGLGEKVGSIERFAYRADELPNSIAAPMERRGHVLEYKPLSGLLKSIEDRVHALHYESVPVGDFADVLLAAFGADA